MKIDQSKKQSCCCRFAVHMWNLVPIGSINVPLNTVDLTPQFSTCWSKTIGIIIIVGFLFYIITSLLSVGTIVSIERHIEPYQRNKDI